MTSQLKQLVLAAIRWQRMMAPGDRVGVAVSGGADSVALLLLLEDLREELGVTLAVVHFNHLLRGPESDADEAFVAQLAAVHGLELLAGREDVRAHAEREGRNVEDAARRLRYEFFARLVAAGRLNRMAVGHTADDQAETVLAHLLRGTGLTGVAGIYPVHGAVVRPLLEVRRAALRDYLRARGQAWREDSTNYDATRLRARLRAQVLPLLERDFQPATVEHLTAFAARAREDEAFWSALVADRFAALVEPPTFGATGLSIGVADLLTPLRHSGLSALPPESQEPLRRRLIRRILEAVKGDRLQFTARHIEQVLHLATAGASGHRTCLPGGAVVERASDRLVFSLQQAHEETAPANVPAVGAYAYTVELPAVGATAVSIPEIGRRLSLKVIDWPVQASDTRELPLVFDRDLLTTPLVVRNWCPGDAYRPCGHRGVHKVNRLLREQKVGGRERVRWPVLTSAGRVVWALGLPPAAEVAPREKTRNALVIVEEA